MKYYSYIWVALMALTLLNPTAETRFRRKVKKSKEAQSDDPNAVQNQQPDEEYEDYRNNYNDYDGYDDNEEEINRKSKFSVLLVSFRTMASVTFLSVNFFSKIATVGTIRIKRHCRIKLVASCLPKII